MELADDEIFVSDGAKSDCANIGELFAPQAVAAVCDPVYPVYVDSSAIAGRAGTYDPGHGAVGPAGLSALHGGKRFFSNLRRRSRPT